jgi:hypothetical protein
VFDPQRTRRCPLCTLHVSVAILKISFVIEDQGMCKIQNTSVTNNVHLYRNGTLSMATEVPISTCRPTPTKFSRVVGREITAAVHMSGRDLWRSKSGASAFIFKIDGLSADRSCMRGLIAAACSAV